MTVNSTTRSTQLPISTKIFIIPLKHTAAIEMAVGGLASLGNAVDEEARAEVDVLNSRLDKTTQLTKKIQACLGRLESTGQSVKDVAGPLSGETKRLQVLGTSMYQLDKHHASHC